MKVAKDMKAEGRLTWIAGEAWGKSVNELFPFEEYALGAFSVNIKSSNVERFDEYFQTIGPNSANVNPWIADFWFSEFKCMLEEGKSWYEECLAEIWSSKYKCWVEKGKYKKCPAEKRFSMSKRYAPERTVSLVYDAVYTYVHAIEKISKNPECVAALNTSKNSYIKCLQGKVRPYMENIRFEGETAKVEYLKRFGYTKRHYEIYNLQKARMALSGSKLVSGTRHQLIWKWTILQYNGLPTLRVRNPSPCAPNPVVLGKKWICCRGAAAGHVNPVRTMKKHISYQRKREQFAPNVQTAPGQILRPEPNAILLYQNIYAGINHGE